LQKKNPRFTYQVYFSKDDGLIAQKELEEDIPRTIGCLFRTSQPDDKIGNFMDENSSSFLSNFPKTPPRSKLLTDEEFDAYVENFKKNGFRGGLNYYKTSHTNWLEEENLPTLIQNDALMITAGQDKILTPNMTLGMEKLVPKLKRAHIEEASHWVQHEQTDLLNTILLDWLNSLQLTSKL